MKTLGNTKGFSEDNRGFHENAVKTLDIFCKHPLETLEILQESCENTRGFSDKE